MRRGKINLLWCGLCILLLVVWPGCSTPPEQGTPPPTDDRLRLSVVRQQAVKNSEGWTQHIEATMMTTVDTTSKQTASYQLEQLTLDRMRVEIKQQQEWEPRVLPKNEPHQIAFDLHALETGRSYRLIVSVIGEVDEVGNRLGQRFEELFHVTAAGIQDGWNVKLPAGTTAQHGS